MRKVSIDTTLKVEQKAFKMEDDAQNRKTYNFAYEILVSWNWSIENGIFYQMWRANNWDLCWFCSLKCFIHLLYSVTQKVYATHFEHIERNLSSAIHLKPILAMRMFTPHRIAHHSKYIKHMLLKLNEKNNNQKLITNFRTLFFQIFHNKNVIVHITDGR